MAGLIRGISITIVIDPIVGNFFFAGVNAFVVVVAVAVIIHEAFRVATIAGTGSESITVPVVVGVGIEGAGGVLRTYNTLNGVTGDITGRAPTTLTTGRAGLLRKGCHATACVPVGAATL